MKCSCWTWVGLLWTFSSVFATWFICEGEIGLFENSACVMCVSVFALTFPWQKGGVIFCWEKKGEQYLFVRLLMANKFVSLWSLTWFCRIYFFQPGWLRSHSRMGWIEVLSRNSQRGRLLFHILDLVWQFRSKTTLCL